jgi:hypothetical protein
MTRTSKVGGLALLFGLMIGCKENSGGPAVAPNNAPGDPAVRGGTGFPATDGKFRAEFPGDPKQMNQNAKGIDVRMWAYEKSPMEVWMLSVNDMPGPSNNAQAEFVLKKSAEGQYAGMKGTMRNSSKTQLAGKYPGIETEGSGPLGVQIRSRIYLVGSKMYQLLALGNQAMVDSDDTKKFFDSFQIVAE